MTKIYFFKLSPTPLASTFRNFTTPRYKFHILEVPTGIKLVLLTNSAREIGSSGDR